MKAAGYSGTPLAKKLGFADGLSVHVAGAPDHYRDLIGQAPGVIWRKTPGIGLAHRASLRPRTRAAD